jgi:hypothetical protein
METRARFRSHGAAAQAASRSPGAEHSRHYVPGTRPGEVLLLKVFDSRSDETAKLTAHSAFDDPSAPPRVAPRPSIELRTLVFG